MRGLLKNMGFVAAFLASLAAQAADKYKLAWSHYTGWEPWGYVADSGIMKKWADKYGIEVEIQLVNDYIESINLYTAGSFDAVVATNMDALTIPAASGVDSTALIIGDYSNGNDGIVSKVATDVKGLKGQQVYLVELSVSHYLLARALDQNGLSERDVKIVNTSDADIASVFVSTDGATAVTWNPPLQQARNAKGAQLVFDSSKIPGEILDIAFVKTQADERFKKALVGAWYEAMQVMSGEGPATEDMIARMASGSGATPAEFRAQMKTTEMFYQPVRAVEFANSPELKRTMQSVRDFSFEKGLLGQVDSADAIGISFTDGTVLGSTSNVKMRFDTTYMKMANDGSL